MHALLAPPPRGNQHTAAMGRRIDFDLEPDLEPKPDLDLEPEPEHELLGALEDAAAEVDALRAALQSERDAHAAQQREWELQLSAQKEKAKKPFLARARSRPAVIDTSSVAMAAGADGASLSFGDDPSPPPVNFTAVKCASSLLARRRRSGGAGSALQPSSESIISSGVTSGAEPS